MSTLPTFTRVIDQEFTDTFFNIKADVVDQVLRQTPLTAILQANGCMVPQTGGTLITRTVGYGTKAKQDLVRGDTLTAVDTQADTSAMWRPRFFGTAIRRDTYRDSENQGPDQIKDYVRRQLELAIDGLGQGLEADLFRNFSATSETTDKGIQSLNDMIPPVANRTTGTYGGINRPTNYTNNVPDAGNTWWSPRYATFTAPVEVNLLADMRRAYNTTGDNVAPPDQIITTQTLFELFEEHADERSQIVIGQNTPLARLGFAEQFFKGKSITWSQNCPANTMFFLNTAFIEFVYDPTLWFQMGEWVAEIGTEVRQASILCRGNLISDQLRRHCRLST